MNHIPNEALTAKEHYSYVTRSIIRLYNAGELTNVSEVAVEPEYGYTSRLTYLDGSHRITYGNDLGLNPGASCDLAKDKGHTKFILRSMGVSFPEGKEFLLPWWADQIRESQIKRGNSAMRTTIDAYEYLDTEIGYPAYIKPVSGSKGSGVHRIDSAHELADVIDEYDENKVRVAVVERAISMPDYRIVMLDGDLISAYQRRPLEVIGDGKNTVRGLIDLLQEKYFDQGRDTRIDVKDGRIVKQLGKLGLSLTSVISEKSTVPLVAISNLSAGGTSVDVTEILNPRWTKLSADIASNFNLRLAGIDLACEDATGGMGNYSVIEVNAAPGLDHYASSGAEQAAIVDSLYTRVINAIH